MFLSTPVFTDNLLRGNKFLHFVYSLTVGSEKLLLRVDFRVDFGLMSV